MKEDIIKKQEKRADSKRSFTKRIIRAVDYGKTNNISNEEMVHLIFTTLFDIAGGMQNCL